MWEASLNPRTPKAEAGGPLAHACEIETDTHAPCTHVHVYRTQGGFALKHMLQAWLSFYLYRFLAQISQDQVYLFQTTALEKANTGQAVILELILKFYKLFWFFLSSCPRMQSETMLTLLSERRYNFNNPLP